MYQKNLDIEKEYQDKEKVTAEMEIVPTTEEVLSTNEFVSEDIFLDNGFRDDVDITNKGEACNEQEMFLEDMNQVLFCDSCYKLRPLDFC